MTAWWHRIVFRHVQRQWGVRIPYGVTPLRREAIVCDCGRRFEGGWST